MLFSVFVSCADQHSIEPEFPVEYPITAYRSMGPSWKPEVTALRRQLAQKYEYAAGGTLPILNAPTPPSGWQMFQYNLRHADTTPIRGGSEIAAWILIGPDGKASKAFVLRSDQSKEVDRRVLAEALNGVRYSSIARHGRPVTTIVHMSWLASDDFSLKLFAITNARAVLIVCLFVALIVVAAFFGLRLHHERHH